jgi:hypothetical protein
VSAVFLRLMHQFWRLGRGSRKACRCSIGLQTSFGLPPHFAVGGQLLLTQLEHHLVKFQTLDREQASLINPLIGISMADTASNVASLMRSVTDSESLDSFLVKIIAELVQVALEFEDEKRGDAE